MAVNPKAVILLDTVTDCHMLLVLVVATLDTHASNECQEQDDEAAKQHFDFVHNVRLVYIWQRVKDFR